LAYFCNWADEGGIGELDHPAVRQLKYGKNTVIAVSRRFLGIDGLERAWPQQQK